MPRPNDVGVGTAVCILNEDNQILLLKRKGAHAEGLWSVPGGWIDRSDTTLLSAVVREAAEEAGVNVLSAEQIGCTTEDHADLGVRTVTVYFVCRPDQWTGMPRLLEPEKASEIGWFDIDALPPDETLFPALPEGIRFLKQRVVKDANLLDLREHQLRTTNPAKVSVGDKIVWDGHVRRVIAITVVPDKPPQKGRTLITLDGVERVLEFASYERVNLVERRW